ncbi:MAG: hypothetical protein HYW24_00140 [Candidatus Aenigmarchaeota archaeon]|nr:hypothetical protein [Candidatus Aenigmarchaeota archaeon]
MPEFITKEEVDSWYKSAMDGIGRVAALHYKQSPDKPTGSSDYIVAAHSLGKTYTRAYELLGIAEQPTLITWEEAFSKHRSNVDLSSLR